MKTLLLCNPHAGRNRNKRDRLIREAITRLSQNGFKVTVAATKAAGSGGAQAREAIERGYEAVFACGGDRTIHDVLQGIIGTNVIFGILPFGSANALARELAIHNNPVRAASAFRPAFTVDVRVGVLRRADESDRYFLSMAGGGPDGALMYRMLTVNRSRLGRLSYYMHAARLFLTQPFPCFEVVHNQADGQGGTHTAIAAMVLRIGSLGGVFAGIARTASLQSPEMLLLIVHPPAWLSLPLWFASSWTRSTKFNPLLTVAHVSRVALVLSDHAKVHLQADGEWLGRGACEIELQETYVRMFLPELI